MAFNNSYVQDWKIQMLKNQIHIHACISYELTSCILLFVIRFCGCIIQQSTKKKHDRDYMDLRLEQLTFDSDS